MQSYLELVLLGLSRRAGVQEIDSENLMRGMVLAWMSEASIGPAILQRRLCIYLSRGQADPGCAGVLQSWGQMRRGVSSMTDRLDTIAVHRRRMVGVALSLICVDLVHGLFPTAHRLSFPSTAHRAAGT